MPGDVGWGEAACGALRGVTGEATTRLALTDAGAAGRERLVAAGAHEVLAWPHDRASFDARLTALAGRAGRADARPLGAPLDHATDAVAAFDAATGLLLDANRAWLALYGYEYDEAIGLGLADVSAEPGRELAAIAEARDGRDARVRVRWHRRKGGRAFPVEVRWGRRACGGGEVACAVVRAAVGRARGVGAEGGPGPLGRNAPSPATGPARVEGEPPFGDRMASLSRLAAGVAHGVNNPLASVLNNVAFALEALARPGGGETERARAVGALEEAAEAASRALEVVRDLKTFARADGGEVAPLDLGEVLAAAARVARCELGPGVTIACEIGPLPPVVGHAGKVSRLFVHLLLNAAQASADAGGGEVRASAHAEPGGRAVVTVEDAGAGIAPELLGRVFDPFFTTRPVGQGAGLGLSVCHGIVTAMGGEISVAPREPRGTRVRVVLPASRRPPSELPRSGPVPAAAPPRRGRVLVVDDDPHVGRSMARLLGAEHDVVVLSDPRRALDALRGGDAYDVVFCDLMMPHLTGMDVEAALRDADPPVPLVFMSAGVFTEEARAFAESCERLCLEKPVEPSALRRLVGEILRAGPAATLRPARRPLAAGARR